MILLIDTSVIIDLRDSTSPFHAWSIEEVAHAVSGDGAAINPVVLSEAAVRATNPEKVPSLIEQLGIALVPLPVSSAVPAANAARSTYPVSGDQNRTKFPSLTSSLALTLRPKACRF